jgi:hypothetical protein
MFGAMRAWPLLFLLVPLLSPAAVYTWVDENGVTVYSDQPRDGARRLDLPGAGDPVPGPMYGGDGEPVTGYDLVEIVNPSSGDTLWSPDGTVEVLVELDPPLSTEDGHTLSLILNGEQLVGGHASPRLLISKLIQTSYTLQIDVVGEDGAIIASSAPILFHLRLGENPAVASSALNDDPGEDD